MRALVLLAAVALLALAVPAAADTPANCTHADVLGHWRVWMSEPGDKRLDCYHTPSMYETTGVKFLSPNKVVSDAGYEGNFTLVYNQGVEMWMSGGIYTILFEWVNDTVSRCDRSHVGWAHMADGSSWQCIKVLRDAPAASENEHKPKHKLLTEDEHKVAAAPAPAPAAEPRPMLSAVHESTLYKTDHAFLDEVNRRQSMFRVKAYPDMERMTVADVARRRGSPTRLPRPEHFKPLHKAAPRTKLPESFDWRNVSGVNYVSPVRNQQKCGSCYAFSAAGMLESRIRVFSNNTQTPILSPQDVVSCGGYSQGCNGGFPYLVAGKYGYDYGFVEEACYPYEGVDSGCSAFPTDDCNPQRWMVHSYYYVGGFYGQSNEEVMKQEIMANGPISVSFEVYDDFKHYAGGVYTHQFTRDLKAADPYNPFHLTNHAVLCVGWGVTDDGVKYWIVKNSWGTGWGEQGYFRILRGSTEPGGECAIESLTVSAIPVLH